MGPPSSTTPLTLDSSTPLPNPMSMMPQAMFPTTLPLKPRPTSTTPLAMLKNQIKRKKKKKKKKKNAKKHFNSHIKQLILPPTSVQKVGVNTMEKKPTRIVNTKKSTENIKKLLKKSRTFYIYYN